MLIYIFLRSRQLVWHTIMLNQVPNNSLLRLCILDRTTVISMCVASVFALPFIFFYFKLLNYLLRGASCIYCGRRVAARVSHGEVAKPVSHTGPGAFFTHLYFLLSVFFFFFSPFCFLTFQFWSETNIAISACGRPKCHWRPRLAGATLPMRFLPKGAFTSSPCSSVTASVLVSPTSGSFGSQTLRVRGEAGHWLHPCRERFRFPVGLVENSCFQFDFKKMYYFYK